MSARRKPSDDVTDAAPELTRVDTAKEIISEFSDDDVPGMAAEIAYHLVLALAPLLIFMISMAAILDNFTGVDVSGQLRDLITDHAPGEAQDVLNTLVDNAVAEAGGGVASFGAIASLLIALFSGSNAIGTIMKAFNRAYDVTEARSFIKRKLVAIGLTVLMALFVNVAFVMFVFGGDIGEWIADWFGLGNAFNWTWNILRFPVAIVLIMFLLSLLYYFGPNIEQSFRWISPGSVISTILWIVVLFGIQIYLTLADPGSAYGVFGGLIVLLFFFYLTGIVFLIGAEINAVIGRQYDPATVGELVGSPAAGELPSDRARRMAQLAPRRPRAPAVRRQVAQELGAQEDGPVERSLAMRLVALGAVTTAVGLMLGRRIKGLVNR